MSNSIRPAGMPFIYGQEVLLVVTDSPMGSYFDETECFGRTFSTEYDALFDEGRSRFGDDVKQFIRFDLEDLHGVDVTEQMAKAFLADWGGRVCDEKILPEFVRTSEAWQDWCEARTVRDGLAFTQRGHGTFSHRQQGLAR